ncbi:MAG: hypothetical protein QM790_19895 [Nibricoccus sp.]
MILDGQYRLSSPVSPIGERHDLRLVPLRDDDAWLQVYLALSRGSDDSPWDSILVRSTLEARVLLGALVDRAGAVHEWLELWFQTTPSAAQIHRTGYPLNNAALDARWDVVAEAMLQTDRGSMLVTGNERTPSRPIWIDVEKGAVWPPVRGEGADIEVCCDETALLAASVPQYSSSASRFLWRKGKPEAGFLKVAGESGAFGAAEPSWASKIQALLPVNPQGGRMLVRRHAPFDLDTYADFLSGRGLGRSQSTSPFVFVDPVNQSALDACDQLQQSGAFLVPTTRGLAGRFLETFHLKLMLFAQIVKAVRAQAELLQMPMLGLSSSSFRVDFAAPAADLPILWTARVSIVDASIARVIPLPATEKRRFQRLVEPRSMVYSAPSGAPPTRGEGSLRIRKLATGSERYTLEATLATDEYVATRDSDIMYLEIPLSGDSSVPVFGRLDTAEALNVHERRFHSFPSSWAPEVHAILVRMEGHAFRQVRFETVPHLGARHDLYSLGVIGSRMLLTHARHTLPESVDELLSLARAMARVDGVTAAQRGQQLALADARWHTALGPQHHGHGCATPEEGYRWVPMELWWDTIATLTRFFPGAGVFSHAPDFNDSTELPLHKTYDEPLRDLERLIQHSRSLLLSDWLANREVARVIQRLR